jgi:flagellar basal-body rod modification protein FlgD
MSHTGATLTPLTDTSTASMFAAMNAANKQAKANATTGSSSASDSGSDSNSLSVDNLGSTFLELLSQELQNQDPTSPIDPTQMVGQMISLNQLDQLIGINQTLTDAASGTTGGSSPGTGTGDAVSGTKAGTAASAISNLTASNSSAAASAAAAQAYMNAAGALLAGTPGASGTQPSADTFNISNLNALSGGK